MQYGLKQAGRNWNRMFSDFLVSLKFQPCRNDPCLFVRDSGDAKMYLCIWVDDVIYFGTNAKEVDVFSNVMKSKFRVSSMSELSWFLGMKVECVPGKICITQEKYIDNLLEQFGMSDCKPVATAGAEKVILSTIQCPVEGSDVQKQMRH